MQLQSTYVLLQSLTVNDSEHIINIYARDSRRVSSYAAAVAFVVSGIYLNN